MKIRSVFLLILCIIFQNVTADEDHKHHVGHSDALLYLLQYKITVKKLQGKFNELGIKEQASNLRKQGRYLKKAMPILESYISIPESHYPNMDMYHQSLQSRGALLEEYTHLLVRFQQQSIDK